MTVSTTTIILFATSCFSIGFVICDISWRIQMWIMSKGDE